MKSKRNDIRHFDVELSRYAPVLREHRSDSPRCWSKIKEIDALSSVIILVVSSRKITEEQ